MNKEELVESVAKQSALNKSEANRVVDAVLKVIGESLKKGVDVRLMGFGTFSVKRRKARNGRNPRTGEAVLIPESKVIAFSAGKALKDAVN